MDRLGYRLGDCSGDHVLASSSFGVTKVVARRKDEDIRRSRVDTFYFTRADFIFDAALDHGALRIQ